MTHAPAQNYPTHALDHLVDDEHGIEVPVTSVSQDASPDGRANPPFTVYRTAGPGGDPTRGLPAQRADWIAGRGDVETYRARGRRLEDDGNRALRRGAASA